MKTTGYKLREAIKTWELRRTLAAEQFNNTLTYFEGEQNRKNPTRVAADFTRADESIARLQTAQTRYNLINNVSVDNNTFTLCEAVKRVGGSGRLEKLWRNAATDKQEPGYFRREHGPNVRKADEVYAQRTITIADASKEATKATRFSNALRAAISIANSREVEIEGIDANLFE